MTERDILELKLDIYKTMLAYTLSNDSSYIVDEIKKIEGQLELLHRQLLRTALGLPKK